MDIKIPELSLVLLVGVSGSGKSTFAKKYFHKYEIVSSDECRGIVSNDINSQSATKDAFDLLYYIVEKRLKQGLLTVVDATNVQKESRKGLIELAKKYHVLPVAIVLSVPKKVCEERNSLRDDRNFGNHVIRLQHQQLKNSIKNLKREGFRKIYEFNSIDEIENIEKITREKLYNNRKEITGPFDIIGDIHGCYDELVELLEKLNYNIETADINNINYGYNVSNAESRQVIFLGDLVDRGPNSPKVLKLVMSMVNSGKALCVPGNHDLKLLKKLNGKNVTVNHGLAETLEQLENEPKEFIKELKEFLYGLVSHYVLDHGKLVVAHAGLKENMQGRGSGAVRAFCLYGETTGETDEFGLPVRYNWAAEYRGNAKVIYGHTPVPEPEWFNKTIDIDTGCVYGGKLTALRYPDDELVSVNAKQTYCKPVKPIDTENTNLTIQQKYDDLLDIKDVSGKRIIQTKLRKNITINEENSIAALEVMSRFAINPKWLIYLPPTMSPSETSELPDHLEYPNEVFDYYKSKGVSKLICEEKHMGSRAVVIICKDKNVAKERFGIDSALNGICYTRTGRNFFTDKDIEKQFIKRVTNALYQSDFWNIHNTDWVCLDTELMPWSLKAQSLIKDQYASVGSAAKNSITEVINVLNKAKSRSISGIEKNLENFTEKSTMIEKYQNAYRNYCWDVNSIDDYILAPFHILATEGNVHNDKNHEWHMSNIKNICDADKVLFRFTNYKIVDLENIDSINEAVDWWLSLTSTGGEGMVVKPYDFVAFGKKGVLQPAIKCRGKEYLRIIYGPEYDCPDTLKRLKKRGLSKKRSLALREFALGIESLERFIKKEPLRRIHESVFGVLALESEEVDPRL